MKLAFIKLLLITLTLSWTNSHQSTANNFCNLNGTSRQSIEGLCECKETVIDSFCDKCKVGFFNLNENGCSRCSCFAGHHLTDGHKKVPSLLNSKSLDEQVECTLAENLVSSTIETDFSKIIDETWPVIELANARENSEDENDVSDENKSELNRRAKFLKSTHRSDFIEFISDDQNDMVYYWILGTKYTGNRLDSYDHELKLRMFYSILRGDVSTDTFSYFKRWSDLILISEPGNHTIAIGCKWFNYASEFESDKVSLLKVTMNETNWFELDSTYRLTDKQVNNALFKVVLMQIKHFLVRAKYHTDQIESRVYEVQLEQSSVTAAQQSNALSNHKLKAIKENCTCSQPFTGPSCEQCESGYFMVIHYKNKLTRRHKKEFLFECIPCPCDGQVCDATGRCLFGHQGGHREDGNKLNGCQNNSSKSSYDVCAGRLVDSMNEFDFEIKLNMKNLKAIKQRSWTILNDLEARHNRLNKQGNFSNRIRKLIHRLNSEYSETGDTYHRAGDDIFESLNKIWLSNKLSAESLQNNLGRKTKSSADLRARSEQTMERLIHFRSEIYMQIDRLATLKYQRLFSPLERKRFYQEASILLKRMRKEFEANLLAGGLKRAIEDSNAVYRNVSNLSAKILMNKNELIAQFDRLFKVEASARELKNYIDDLEMGTDFVIQLVYRLNKQLATIEQLNSDAENENVAIEQTIVDANYINNFSRLIVEKLELFDSHNDLNRLDHYSHDLKHIRMNAENEAKYGQICEIHVSNLKEDLIKIEKLFNNSQIIKQFLKKCTSNQTTLYHLQTTPNQLNEIDLYIENFLSIDELKQQIEDLKQNKTLVNRSHRLIELTSEINLSVYEIANKLNCTRRRLEKVQNSKLVIDGLDKNVKSLQSIEEDLKNLTERSVIANYMDELSISPVIELKITDHETTLAILNYETLPDYSRRLSNLKLGLSLHDDAFYDHVQHIHSNVEIKKRYIESFEFRSSKIKSIYQQNEMMRMQIDQRIRQARNVLTNIKMNLGMKYQQAESCRRLISLHNLVASSSIEIEFYYSIGHLIHHSIRHPNMRFETDSNEYSATGNLTSKFNIIYSTTSIDLDNHTILMIGSFDGHFILFKCENRQLKVILNFQNSRTLSHLTVPFRLRTNNEHFKDKQAYYKVKFERVAQESRLSVSPPNDDEKVATMKDDHDLIMKPSNKIRFGLFQSSLIKQSSTDQLNELSTEQVNESNESNEQWLINKPFVSVISDLKMNAESIGLWNYASSTAGCLPMKNILNNDANQPDEFVFNGRNSYLSLSQINRYEKHRYSIRIVFRTFARDGLLFTSFNEANRDLILIRFHNGRLHLLISTRRHQLTLIANNTYNNGYMYTIVVERENHFGMLMTDLEQLEGYFEDVNDTDDLKNSNEKNQMKSISKSTYQTNSTVQLEMDLENSFIFVGGLPADRTVHHLDYKSFYGCIKLLQIETALINLNNQDSFGVNGSSKTNLIKQMAFHSTDSSIKFQNLTLNNWTNFGFSFRTLLVNCSILSLNSSPVRTVKRAISLNLMNDRLVFNVIEGDEYNSTLLNGQNYILNDGDYHSILFINDQSSIKVMIDKNSQTEILENLHFENLAQLIEQLSVLSLGKLPGLQLNELNLENRFVGSLKDFILNNKLINLDLYFEQMNDVEISS